MAIHFTTKIKFICSRVLLISGQKTFKHWLFFWFFNIVFTSGVVAHSCGQHEHHNNKHSAKHQTCFICFDFLALIWINSNNNFWLWPNFSLLLNPKRVRETIYNRLCKYNTRSSSLVVKLWHHYDITTVTVTTSQGKTSVRQVYSEEWTSELTSVV